MDDRHYRPGYRRRLRWGLGLGSAGAALVTGAGLAAGAAAVPPPASPTWARATGIKLPSGGVTADLFGVGCTGSGFCAAAGQFQKSLTGTTLPMVITYASGKWAQAVALRLPKTAAAVPKAAASDVACTSSTSCEVVGRFRYAADPAKNNAFIADLTGSTWTQARTMALPANKAAVTSATLMQIACASKGNCGALGEYTDNRGDLETSAFIEKNGTWARGTEIKAPANARPAGRSQNMQPFGISCPAPGDCVAVGKYYTTGGDIEPYRATATSGVWARAVQVGLPADAITGTAQAGDFHAVYCTSVGNCLALGNYRIASYAHTNATYSLRETAGSWPSAGTRFIPKPANGAHGTSLIPQDNGVACPGGGCVMAGFYSTTSGQVEALSDAWSGSPTPSWQQAVEVLPPADASATGHSLLRDVSCWSTWNCVAVGTYLSKSGHGQALAAVSS